MTMRRITIIQGEQATECEPGVVLSTLLGSCVALCLQDPVARIGGMNHFLLGEPGPGIGPSDSRRDSYGLYAMELLIDSMLCSGAVRSRLRAQLYGGANIIAGMDRIGSQNAAFARRFLATKDIMVSRSSMGGTQARKIDFLPYEGRVRCTVVPGPSPAMLRRTVPTWSRAAELI
jgi:chemotaxis protein CheD